VENVEAAVVIIVAVDVMNAVAAVVKIAVVVDAMTRREAASVVAASNPNATSRLTMSPRAATGEKTRQKALKSGLKKQTRRLRVD
jgi:hypothetical protein